MIHHDSSCDCLLLALSDAPGNLFAKRVASFARNLKVGETLYSTACSRGWCSNFLDKSRLHTFEISSSLAAIVLIV
jgi:hypothetical protein